MYQNFIIPYLYEAQHVSGEVAKSYLSLRCVSLSACNNTAPTRRIFMKFDVGEFFEKSIEKIQILLKSDKNNRYVT